jgi:CRP/FNR family cyclic AMP-dependent transcriptional regulator
MEQHRAHVPEQQGFGQMAPSLADLATYGLIRRYRKKAIVMTEGDFGDSLYIVLHGQVKIFAAEANGRELTFAVIGAGEFFGELALDGGPRSASAMALQPTTCVVVPGSKVRQRMQEDPGLALEVVTRVLKRSRSMTETARQLALVDVYGRVVQVLEGERGPASSREAIELDKLTHQQIASRVGASREMVSRLLKDLERGGYVALGMRRITLMKRLPARW